MPFGFYIIFNFLKINGSTFSTAAFACIFGIERTNNHSCQINPCANKENQNNDLLKHEVKLRSKCENNHFNGMIHSSAFGRKPSISNNPGSSLLLNSIDFDEFVMASILAKAVHNNFSHVKELSENCLPKPVAQ